MTTIETAKILTILRAAYPNFYKDMTRADTDKIVSLWAEMFSDEPYQLVAAAVKALITSSPNPFPPVIGEIKEQIQKLSAPKGELSEQEAWGVVFSKLSNCIYNSREQFDSLPPVIKQVVGSPSQLYEWALMDTNTLQSVVASNFMRSYKARAASYREYSKLPADVRRFAERLTSGTKNIDQIEDSDEKRKQERIAQLEAVEA